MTALQVAVVVFCGLLIGLAIILLIRTVRKMAAGKCCEGCKGCSQAENCSSAKAPEASLDDKNHDHL